MIVINPIILVADDDDGIRMVINEALTRGGYKVKATESALTLWKWVSSGIGDLVITDVLMPDENGLELLPKILERRPNLRVIVMSAQTTMMTALKANERGAFEYLPKPFDINELSEIVKRALEEPLLETGGSELQPDEVFPLIGRSQAMQDIFRTIARLMNNDLTVLITGETGTGKDMVAKVLHDYGKRKKSPFVAVNMAAIPKDLIESELFGHEKGAFTGAGSRTDGKFSQANEGTLFLDEIGDMPIDAQTRLLRVLQDGEFTSVGGRKSIKTDVRIISATNKDLKKLIRQGKFREDLFFRLNVVPIRLPSLSERQEDIPELVQSFITKAAVNGLPWKIINKSALKVLKSYSWPGNIRELENLVNRLVALYSQEIIDANIVTQEISNGREIENETKNNTADQIEKYLKTFFKSNNGSLPEYGLYNRVIHKIERPLIILTLESTRGNQVKAADVLGINRNTLREKMRKLNIPIVRGEK